MLFFSLKILIGDKAKFIGIILGLSFSALIITQQSAIFVGLMARTFGFVTDISQSDIWVMDEKLQYIDDVKPLRDTQLYLIKGIEGVQWAVPFYKGLLKVRLRNGNFQMCNVIGIDNATLIGGPPKMLQGKLNDLRLSDAIIVNKEGADDKLALVSGKNGKKLIPMQVGETVEINDHRAKVVGICETTRTFQSQPVIYTTYARATTFAPFERKLLSFVLVKAAPNVNLKELCQKIDQLHGLKAYTNKEFKWLTIDYYTKETGILINFGVAVILGIIIGIAISGQTFYNFILDNLRYLATFKAMGANNRLLTKMVLLQAAWVGFIGWGLGIGIAALFGIYSQNSPLSFLLLWQLYVSSCLLMFLITGLAAWIGLYRIYRLDPAIVFKGQ